MFELIIMISISLLFFILGYLLWKKQKISLIHYFHYSNVQQKDIKPYTEQIGKGLIIIGIGFLITGIIDFFTKLGYGWMITVISFVVGVFVIIRAQLRYNRGIV